MGRIRTKDVKDLARDLYAAHTDSFSQDFEQNKAAIGELKIAEGKSKRFRNRVAGYIVCLARQAAHGHHPAGERAPGLSSGASEHAWRESNESKATAAEEAKESQSETEETKAVEQEEKSE